MGTITVPDGLRALGVDVVTLSERYGEQEGQRLADVDWMPDVAARGEVALMSDSIHKKKDAEAEVLRSCGLRAFVVNASLPAAVTVERFRTALAAIERACRRPGPFVYRLHPTRIERLAIRGEHG